jgi:hypothetical protein
MEKDEVKEEYNKIEQLTLNWQALVIKRMMLMMNMMAILAMRHWFLFQ